MVRSFCGKSCQKNGQIVMKLGIEGFGTNTERNAASDFGKYHLVTSLLSKRSVKKGAGNGGT